MLVSSRMGWVPAFADTSEATDELNHYGLKVHRFGAKAPPWTSHGLKAAVLKVRSFDYNALRALKRAGTVNDYLKHF